MNQSGYSVGVYARLSVDSQDEKMESIETQLEAAGQYIQARPGLRLFDCYTDAGRSGTNFRRDGFERMMRDVRRGNINCILVRDFSRFGRNYIETGNYIQNIFPSLGVRFISIDDGYDSLVREKDELGVNLKNLINELYARDISGKVKSSRRILWEGGNYTGGCAPYGYMVGWKGEHRFLLPDPAAAEVVRNIYALSAAGNNRKQIARRLYEQGVHRPADYRRYGHVFCRNAERLLEWSSAGLRSILHNPVYTGCLVRRRSDGGGMEERAGEDGWPESWEVLTGTHEALISREEFFRIRAGTVQTLHIRAGMEENRKKTGRTGPGPKENRSPGKYAVPMEKEKAAEQEYFPEQLLFCGVCGRRMASAGGSPGPDGIRSVRGYYCRRSSRIDALRCERAYLTGQELMRIIGEGLKRGCISIPGQKEALSAGLDRLYEQEEKKRSRQLAKLSEKIAGKEQCGSAQYLRYRRGKLDREAFLVEKEKNGELLRALREKKAGMEQKFEEQRKLLEEYQKLPDAWLRGEIPSACIREMGKALIREIRVFPDKRAEIIFRFRQPEIPGVEQEENTGGNCHAP